MDSGATPADTPVVFSLLILCALAFLAELTTGNSLIDWLGLWPLGLFDAGSLGDAQFHPWQIVTYAFLHGGLLNLALNLYALLLFGVPLERRWGSQRFAVFFFACVIGAALVHLAVAEFFLFHGRTAYPVTGAAGGVFGLLLAFGMLYPDVELTPLFRRIHVKALWFAIGYGVAELVAGVTGTAAGTAHFDHLGGMLTGFVLLRGAGWLP
jgi:membrane associated rhomboid family serine protease